MSTAPESSRLTKADVCARLAQGQSAGVTVVTPNRRLALAFRRDFDAVQMASGRGAWDTSDILPFTAFLERAYEGVLYSARAGELPVLLGDAQEHALWENIIRNSEAGAQLLAVPETARLAREAWQLVCAWQLAPGLKKFSLSEDGKAFAGWSQRYERDTGREGWTEGARLAGLVAAWCRHPEMRKPQLLVCYGFDVVTPQQQVLFTALRAADCEVAFAQARPRGGNATRVGCKDRGDEIQCAATWARARLEANGAARIGIVVPDLAARRSAIMRLFGSTMAPDYALPGTGTRTSAFNVSLGTALTSYPLVNTAFLLLELAGREMKFERASRLLRSPFLGGSETEMQCRARLDAQMRSCAEPVVTLDGLQALTAHTGTRCPLLALHLSALADARKARLFGAQSPSAYALAISEALAGAGFPGERSLDSTEYQTLKKWHEILAAFAALDRVVPRLGYADAVSRLRRMAAETLFQPETPDVPIQILGVFEAASMEFDHLWVMGLSDEAWPPSPRPNPFLPIELQRSAKIPQSSAVESLELARRLTAEWLTSADEVVLSHPQREDDRAFKPSPLISQVNEYKHIFEGYPSYRDIVHMTRRLESHDDSRAPALGSNVALRAGTTVIRDQAACPFRAFALHRLGAASLETPHTGLDAMERGTLVHRVLARVWEQLKTRSALDAVNPDDLEAMLVQAATDAVARIRRERPATLSGRFANIEQRRLTRLARAWLDFEKTRGLFTVVATEDRRQIAIGSLSFNARLDRVDELESGARIVIDYKTSAPSPAAMLGERPDEPQLPLYLVAAEPAAVAVAFAQVKTGDMRVTALARDAGLLPGIKAYAESYQRDHHASWADVVAAWRAGLARLADAFADGAAPVDPKQHPQTCRYCDAKPLCRIHERAGSSLDEDAA